MDVREKLVDIVCDATQINGCIHSCNHPPCAMVRGIVDALIQNGVTVQELNGCDFCQKFDFAGARAEVNKYGAHISLGICSTKFPNKEQFKFCPMCGRRLPQPPKGE